MDDTASVENIRILLGERTLEPISVEFVPANGLYMTVAQIPESTEPGEAEVRVQFRDLLSDPVKTLILPKEKNESTEPDELIELGFNHCARLK